MKPKKASGAFREDNEFFKGKKKHRLTPIKKQKSKRTKFFDEIEDFEEDKLNLTENDLENFHDDLDDIDDFDDLEDPEDY